MPVVDFTKAQVAAIPYVDDTRCLACGKCVARSVCKTEAILRIDRDEPPFIDSSLCYGCLACIPECPADAIRLPKDRE